MSRRHYLRDDLKFAEIAEANPDFAPRFHLLYTEREAEQDAYFWFLQGQRKQLDSLMTQSNQPNHEGKEWERNDQH